MSAFGIRNQCLFLVTYSAVILLIAFAMSGSESNTTVTRYVCCSCEARKRPSFFNSRKGAHQHITKSSRCHGSKVKSVKIMIRPGDVIAGGAGGMGQCPLPQHQPPGNWDIYNICMYYKLNITRIHHTILEYFTYLSDIFSHEKKNIRNILWIF
jgi:hypothetical protein